MFRHRKSTDNNYDPVFILEVVIRGLSFDCELGKNAEMGVYLYRETGKKVK